MQENSININIYSIWSEGYSATGGCSGAFFHGTSKGSNFKEACNNLAKNNLNFTQYYDEDKMTYWGCKLFDNELDTRRNFG